MNVCYVNSNPFSLSFDFHVSFALYCTIVVCYTDLGTLFSVYVAKISTSCHDI